MINLCKRIKDETCGDCAKTFGLIKVPCKKLYYTFRKIKGQCAPRENKKESISISVTTLGFKQTYENWVNNFLLSRFQNEADVAIDKYIERCQFYCNLINASLCCFTCKEYFKPHGCKPECEDPDSDGYSCREEKFPRD